MNLQQQHATRIYYKQHFVRCVLYIPIIGTLLHYRDMCSSKNIV